MKTQELPRPSENCFKILNIWIRALRQQRLQAALPQGDIRAQLSSLEASARHSGVFAFRRWFTRTEFSSLHPATVSKSWGMLYRWSELFIYSPPLNTVDKVIRGQLLIHSRTQAPHQLIELPCRKLDIATKRRWTTALFRFCLYRPHTGARSGPSLGTLSLSMVYL